MKVACNVNGRQGSCEVSGFSCWFTWMTMVSFVCNLQFIIIKNVNYRITKALLMFELMKSSLLVLIP